jgi:hypothetical protein
LPQDDDKLELIGQKSVYNSPANPFSGELLWLKSWTTNPLWRQTIGANTIDRD